MASTKAGGTERSSSSASFRSQDTINDEPFIMRRIRAFSKDLDCQALLCDECKEAEKPSVPTETFCGRCNRNLCDDCAKAHKKAILSIINTAQTFDKATSTSNKTPLPKNESVRTSGASLPTPGKPNVDHLNKNPSTQRTPDVNKSARRTPDVEKSALRTPDIDQSARRTPDVDKSARRTPDVDKSARRTPDIDKSARRKPDVDKSARRTPDVEKSALRTPDIDQSARRTPDIDKSVRRTPDVDKSARRTPDIDKSARRTPDVDKSARRTPDVNSPLARQSDVRSPTLRGSSVQSSQPNEYRPTSSRVNDVDGKVSSNESPIGMSGRETSSLSKSSIDQLKENASDVDNKEKHGDSHTETLTGNDDNRPSSTAMKGQSDTPRRLSKERAQAISLAVLNVPFVQETEDTNRAGQIDSMEAGTNEESDPSGQKASGTGDDEYKLDNDVKLKSELSDVAASSRRKSGDNVATMCVDVSTPANKGDEIVDRTENDSNFERQISSTSLSSRTKSILSNEVQPHNTSTLLENCDTEASIDETKTPIETVKDGMQTKADTTTGVGLTHETTNSITSETNTNESSLVMTNGTDNQSDVEYNDKGQDNIDKQQKNEEEEDGKYGTEQTKQEDNTLKKPVENGYYFYSNGQDDSSVNVQDEGETANSPEATSPKDNITDDVEAVKNSAEDNKIVDEENASVDNDREGVWSTSEKTFEIDDETIQTDIGDFEFQGEVPIKSMKDEYSCDVSDMAFLSEDELVLADKNNVCLKVVAVETGIVTQYIHLEESPRGVAALPTRRLAVAIPDMKQLVILSVLDRTYKVDKKILVDGYCFDVAYADGKLVVPYVSPGLVKIHDLDGSVLVTCSFDYKTPQYVSVCPDSHGFLVSDGMGRLVTINDWNGDVLNVYKFSETYVPLGVTAITPNSFIVCFSTRSQLKWVTDDENEDSIVTKTLDIVKKPKTIVFSPASRLMYVGSCKRELSGPDCNLLKAFRINF